jgi:predicted DsbA family dithiol-disulfide isomerase
MHDLWFANQSALRPDGLIAYAEQLGLDVESFTNDLTAHAAAARVDYGAYDIAALSAAVRAAGARASLATAPQ